MLNLDSGLGSRRGVYRRIATPFGMQRIGCASLVAIPAAQVREQAFSGTVPKFFLNYVVEGSGWYEDEHHGRVPFSAGSFFQRMPFRAHRTGIDPTTYRECYCFFHFDLIEHFQQLQLMPPSQAVLPGSHDPRILAAFQELERCLRMEGSQSWPRMYAALVQVLSWTYRQQRGQTDPAISAVLQIAEQIRETPEQRRDLDGMAAACGLSRDAFRKSFRRHLGMSPGAFQIRCRLDRACVLLQDLPIKQVAAQLGYPDAQSFSKQFHRYIGCSPGSVQREGL